jgi:hypothetical protein
MGKKDTWIPLQEEIRRNPLIFHAFSNNEVMTIDVLVELVRSMNAEKEEIMKSYDVLANQLLMRMRLDGVMK